MELTKDKPNNGYGEPSPKGGTAQGRYQITEGTLKSAGWKNDDGTWSEKANEAGVRSDQDFRSNPEAQEQALTDALAAYHGQLKTNRALDYTGKTITDSAGNQLTVTESGLMAASHLEGAGAVHRYLRAATNGALGSPPSDVGNAWQNIERRLQKFATIPYDEFSNAREAITGKTGPHAPKKK